MRFCTLLLMAAALADAQKPSREIQELQRDVAQLQEIVKGLQRVVEERIGGLSTQVQSAADAASKAGVAAGAVQRSLEQLAADQERKLAAPVATLGGRMEQISGALGTVQQAVSELTSVVSKLQTQIGELTIAVKAGTGPAPLPPGPPMGANEMLESAERDRSSGKLDLALQGFQEFLKWYGDTPQADAAWYATGSIHFALKDYERALNAFNAVLEKYPKSAKTPDALYYKSRSLSALGRAKEAIEINRELRRRFPKYSSAQNPQ